MDTQNAHSGADSVAGVHHPIGRHAQHHPDALAVHEAATGRRLAYRELWNLSGSVAERLTAAGVRPGDACGIALDRGADLVVAMLAVARTGARYVPLDNAAPSRRSAAQLADTAARALVVAPGDVARAHALAPELPAIEAVRACADDPLVTSHPSGPDDALYVNFTSGTSGLPKAVVVPHRAVRRLVDAPTYCALGPGTRVGSAANPSFDATTFEIWATLSARGTVVVLPPVVAAGLDDWLELLRTEQVDALFLTTALFHMIAHERPAALAVLDTLLVGGEALAPEAARRVLAAGPPKRLVNVYGPTETTTFATYYDLTPERLDGVDRVPIGHAIQHTTLHVLGPDLSPVPDGERGELCIGGPGVALGYHGRPDLTAERFVTVPGAEHLGRLYRTGDVVRTDREGRLEIFGRLDRQVKMRGFRIELEEIERAALATGLVEAAVVEKTGEGASAALVGFVAPAGEDGPEGDALVAGLRAALAEVLPDYMLPARWIVLDRLPLGPTGKVDRVALLDGAVAAETMQPASTGPVGDGPPEEDPLPRDVLRLWCEVLDMPEASGADNFIASGGNSILAIQLSSRISEAASVDLGPADVLLAADLTELIDVVRRSTAGRG
ncbi:amino acid adenylation protein [Streptomyces capoamus]|uniref:Amino acid adenylation protein n=1 Tax=Streptomyces capoamus TaxID=68183 RepID=A0A919C3L4_9ACTN|nr:non-ribosomal peptide synthetase [Streptomyces capoamus]GGW16448.1 amino acid adenylation protein [Streptomyces libani subsp. rufus]GHG42856.1 amino acid adenylation protein [Streptomyces capoamus]